MNFDSVWMPMRIQIALHNVLVAECIVHWKDVDRTWSAYAVRKYDAGLPIGGASIQLANLPRTWDVPVGSVIYEHGVN